MERTRTTGLPEAVEAEVEVGDTGASGEEEGTVVAQTGPIRLMVIDAGLVVVEEVEVAMEATEVPEVERPPII